MSEPSTEGTRKDTPEDSVEDAEILAEETAAESAGAEGAEPGAKIEETEPDAEESAASEPGPEQAEAAEPEPERPAPVAEDTREEEQALEEDAILEEEVEEPQGSSLASTALKFVVAAIVIFAFSLWLIPRSLPESWAANLMPAQVATDQRIAAIEAQLAADTSAETIAALEARLAEMQERLEEAEQEAIVARVAAEDAAGIAASLSVAESVVSEAGDSADRAATAAETATTAATESGRVASAAMRDAASLARRMTGFEAQIAAVSDELTALGQSLASTLPADGSGGTSQEAGAAYAALKTRLDDLVAQINMADYLTGEDAAIYATQGDLRAARTALTANLEAALSRLPVPEEVPSKSELAEIRDALQTTLADLSTRVGAMEGNMAATEAAAAAAEGQVQEAIKLASIESAAATMMSRLEHGQPFAAALGKVASLSGVEPPPELADVAATGTATPAELLRGFGAAYQEAIAADIREQSDGGLFGNATARLRSVVAGRPKGAQEGETVEAILSRVEAALGDEDPATALAETTALSEAVRAALGDWLAALEKRAAAMTAAADYTAGLAGNAG